MQKALEHTAEKTVGLQPLVTQLSNAVHQMQRTAINDDSHGWLTNCSSTLLATAFPRAFVILHVMPPQGTCSLLS